MKRKFLATCFFLLGLVLSSSAQSGETLLGPVTRTYLIRNAHIIPAPGRIIQQGDVLIRDGLIVAVSDKPITPPFDAEIIDGDSLYVYAGFIDGLSHAGIPKPRKKEGAPARVKNPGNPPPERAGIQPQRTVLELLKPDEKTIKELRKLGFTLTHTVPREGMLPGKSALILLVDAQTPDELILRQEYALFSQFQPARRMYPATPMGIMAKWRQLYRRAEQLHSWTANYEANPSGLQKPPYSAIHWSFFPVIEKKQPVIFRTENALDAWRALKLQRELQFNLILADLRESWDLLHRIVQQKTPVFVSLNLPEPKKEKKETPADTTQQTTAFTRTTSFKDTQAEYQRLKARRDSVLKRYYGHAAELQHAGVLIGFSTIGAKTNKIQENLRRMIANGLSEDAALAALTTNPAQILGIDQLVGTVEPGKLANLVLTTGPYFSKQSKVRYVFVQGEKYSYPIKPKKKKDQTATESESTSLAIGTWEYTIPSPQGELSGTFVIEDVGGVLQGSMTNMFSGETVPMDEVNLEGNTLTFKVTMQIMSEQLTLTVSGTITGDSFEGSIEAPGQGTFPITATRISGPENQ